MSNEVESTSNETTPEVGTTERLFGPQDDDGASPLTTPPAPVTEGQDEPPAEEVKARPRDDKGKFVTQTAPEPGGEYIDLSTLADKKVKVKIGGVEKDITLRDLQKGYQTDQYLTQKGQTIAEQYRQLQAQAKPEQPKAAHVPQATIPDDDFTREYIKPFADKQETAISALQQEIERLKSITQPMEYQNNLSKVDHDMKAAGYDDFMQYVPKITESILNMPVEQQVAYDTDWGFKSIYKDIKLAEMKEVLSKSKTETKLPDQRPKPRVVNVESGGGTPTGNDDTTSIYNAALEKAKQSGRMQDFARAIELKYSR
jgi:hypothetical protein